MNGLYCKFRGMKDSHIKPGINPCYEGTTTGQESAGRELPRTGKYSIICGNNRKEFFSMQRFDQEKARPMIKTEKSEMIGTACIESYSVIKERRIPSLDGTEETYHIIV
jgi:hypothetical protein